VIEGNQVQTVHKNERHLVSEEYAVSARRVIIRATDSICLSVGGNFIQINKAGVQVEGKPFVDINCGSTASDEPASPPLDPGFRKGPTFDTYPEEPAGADNARSGFVSAPRPSGS
jgi:type VI secretion system secreted protein VgrG